MGHLHSENISTYLIHKLLRNCYEYKNGQIIAELDEPKPLTVKDAINHFLKKIKIMDQVIELVKNDNSKIFTEDILFQKKNDKRINQIKGKPLLC